MTLVLVVLAWAVYHFLSVVLPRQRAPAIQQAQMRTVTGLELDLVWIAPGTFGMGLFEETGLKKVFRDAFSRWRIWGSWTRAKRNPGVVRQVTISKPFWLGKTEVTQAQWQALMGSNPSKRKGDTLPVGSISWQQAMEFCQKLTERENLAGRLPEGYIYTLPTEAQWEYACRAGVQGNDAGGGLKAFGWFTQEVGGFMQPIGRKRPNAWGIYDMHGNASEWCLDWYAEYPTGSSTDPVGPISGKYRVHRGGCSSNYADECGSGQRGVAPADSRTNNIGLRLALSPIR